MQKRIAILYDFDYTLSKGYMQSFGLAKSLGFDNVYDYFADNDSVCEDPQMDVCLALLGGLLIRAKEKNIKVTREYLNAFGKNIEYYDGVPEWFDKINEIGKKLGYTIEHYVVSSGMKEIIEGTSIAKNFKRIYACCYAYKDGVAFWPSQIVNYTSKTQYIYRIRKNALDDLKSLKKINKKFSDEKVLDFKNIIYIGDSETDIPSFKVIKNSGGLSICVYEKGNEKARKVANKCLLEGRINWYTPADYSEGSELYNLIKDYIENIANNQCQN